LSTGYQFARRPALSEVEEKHHMKFASPNSMPALGLIYALALSVPVGAQSQRRYTLTDLGPAGNPFSQATGLNDSGLVTGLDTASDGTQHALAWYWGTLTDISQPGLGGPNSAAGGVNKFGQIIGIAETAANDPNKENFCVYGTGKQCLTFLWDFGVMTPLPTLGGTNSTYGAINNLGEVAGIAETNQSTSCNTGVAANGTGPQVLNFEAVVWGPAAGQIRELSPLPGDTVGMAIGINDGGQAVGASGSCANTVVPGFAAAPHAVLWERDGTPHSLPSLGGSEPDTTVLGAGTFGCSINNAGIVAGQATLSDNKTWHPVLWQDGIVSDLGVLQGDLVGIAAGINNRGEVVGASVSAPGPATGNPRAYVWRNGVMTDLNSLVPATSPLYLLTAFAINDSGEIVGFGATDDGDLHGFLATPCRTSSGACSTASATGAGEPTKRRVNLSEDARKTLLRSGLRGR
jgi:probable HAF family extracellular repeat protein